MNFQQLEGDFAIIAERGVFKDAPLYSRNGALFVKAKGGFVRLNKDGSTSVSSVALKELITDSPLFYDSFGRLSVDGKEGCKSLHKAEQQKLVGK